MLLCFAADDTPPDTSFVAVVKQNAHILSFIALLLILTFICSYFEVSAMAGFMSRKALLMLLHPDDAWFSIRFCSV